MSKQKIDLLLIISFEKVDSVVYLTKRGGVSISIRWGKYPIFIYFMALPLAPNRLGNRVGKLL